MGRPTLRNRPSLASWFHACATNPESDIAPHFPTFVRLIVEHRVRGVIELGVRTGQSTAAWLYYIGRRGHVWSVDIEEPWLPHRTGWTLIVGDDTDPDVAAQLPGLVDLLFIDTDHAYAHTLAELDLYGPRVRSGGVIVLHDTENEQPEQHGESIGLQPPFPVRVAMEQWAEAQGFATWNDPASWGLGVIYVA
jgi:cephalosporin hydroxylase